MESVFRQDILAGKVAFVTGGGSGICKGITEALMAHGANTVITSRKQEKLDAASAELEKATGEALPRDRGRRARARASRSGPGPHRRRARRDRHRGERCGWELPRAGGIAFLQRVPNRDRDRHARYLQHEQSRVRQGAARSRRLHHQHLRNASLRRDARFRRTPRPPRPPWTRSRASLALE